MKKLTLKHLSSSYPIVVGSNILENIASLLPVKLNTASSFIIIFDHKVKKQAEIFLNALKKNDKKTSLIGLKVTEKIKSLEMASTLYEKLLKLKADRQTVLVGIGGGVIGDLAGFVAATYLRGVKWIGIPTTLLSQVDSSIGGKTGVNHPQGKNLVGAFHQPSLVICDLNFLKSLPHKDIVSGLGEIYKYGLSLDPNLFQYLKKNQDKLLTRDPAVLEKLVFKCLKLKAMIVQKDEFETKGLRDVLNFGHTFGHALEKELHQLKLRHGEAVIWGMLFALNLSLIKKKIPLEQYHLISTILLDLPVKKLPRRLPIGPLIDTMKKDKKAEIGKIRFILLKNIGQTVKEKNITQIELEKAFVMLKDFI